MAFVCPHVEKKAGRTSISTSLNQQHGPNKAQLECSPISRFNFEGGEFMRAKVLGAICLEESELQNLISQSSTPQNSLTSGPCLGSIRSFQSGRSLFKSQPACTIQPTTSALALSGDFLTKTPSHLFSPNVLNQFDFAEW